MKTLKNRFLILACCLSLVCAGVLLASCGQSSTSTGASASASASAASSEAASASADAAEEGPAPSEAVAGTETMPSFMPVEHQSYVGQPSSYCYTCHGATATANPAIPDSTALPSGHYKDNDPSTMEIDPLREACITCHTVDPQKHQGDGKKS